MSRILVVDDDELTRDYVGQILASTGHAVENAASAAAGLAALRARPVDLVITDMVMPNTDGAEFITMLQKEQPKLPIIAMSGAPVSAQFLYLASYLGAGKMLTKPFTPEVLLSAVTEALA